MKCFFNHLLGLSIFDHKVALMFTILEFISQKSESEWVERVATDVYMYMYINCLLVV